MNKLKFVLAAIFMPFLYSIGCEPTIASDLRGLVIDNSNHDPYLHHDYLQWVKFFEEQREGMIAVHEGDNPGILFMGSSTSMLAGILLPVILLDVPVDSWDTYCTGLNNNRSSFGVKSFAFNKVRSDYPGKHLIPAEGKPVYENGKWVVINPLLYKETDPITGRASVITYWKDGYYAIEHQKGSDNAIATPLSRAQSRAIEKRLCEINGVTSKKVQNIEPLEMIYE